MLFYMRIAIVKIMDRKMSPETFKFVNYFASQKAKFNYNRKILSSLAIWLKKNIGFIYIILFLDKYKGSGVKGIKRRKYPRWLLYLS